MFPASSRMAQSTPSSMSIVTTSDADRRRDQQLAGEVDLLDEVPVADSAPRPMLRPFWKKFQGMSAHSRNSANECNPLGSPTGGSIFRK